MPKIPEISVGIQMETSVSVSSDRNIRDHLWRWSTYFAARKTYLITARARKKKRTARMLASARKDHSIPLLIN